MYILAEIAGKKCIKLQKSLAKNEIFFKEMRGAFAEQFVFQELRANRKTVYYYSRDNSKGEIDFMLDTASSVLPIEVKAGSNVGAASLHAFLERFPEIPRAIKFSALPERINDKVENLPLYLTGFVEV